MLSSGILEVGKNIFAFKNDFLYSADVKPTVNKNRFDFIYWLHRACSLHISASISMDKGHQLFLRQILKSIALS